jgi:RNA polymerase sigma factor (sigma-70 family)
MIEDTELLRRYADEGAEAAFAELVQRHVNLVYSAALRQVGGEAHLAADATQLVFVDLARKAKSLARHRVLAGWLFTSTRYAARNLVRTEQRRRAREQEALRMEELNAPEDAAELDWQRVRGTLDAAMGELGRVDREALLLRFFEGREYADVGAKLNLSANTARMRVERALDRLRGRLERRGVASTAAALGAALTGQAVAAAPAGMAASVAQAALAGAATAAGPLALAFMGMTKLQMGVAGALVVAGVGGFVVQHGELAGLRREIAELARQGVAVAQLRADTDRLARASVEVADLRLDDALLKQLSEEALALQTRWRAVGAAARSRMGAGHAPLEGPIHNLSSLTRVPQIVAQPRPVYPMELVRAGVSGEAVISFVVDTEGRVRDTKAVSSTRREFEAAALEALQRWQFTPGEKDGRRVNTNFRVPIVFTLGDDKNARLPTFWF